MKITFRGWRREVVKHTHEVVPVKATSTGYVSGNENAPIEWNSSTQVIGKLNNLALTGNFLVEFEFSEQELIGWLKQHVKNEPISAIKLLAELQIEAVSNLKNTLK